MKKLFKTAILSVIAVASLALVIPSPVSDACVLCLYKPCPPCTRLQGQTCYRCGSCQAIPGCEPR